ncbi:Dipeptidyl aminopeptidase-like protein 6, partial [Trichinella pseudospiralis]
LCTMSEEDDFSAEVEYVSDKELMTGDAPQRNWWGIGIALLVILTITAIISSNDNVTPFTIEDIVYPKANEINPGVIWLSVDTFAYKDAKCNIWLVSIFNDQINRTLLIDDRSCQNRHIISFKPSATAQYIAFSYETLLIIQLVQAKLVYVYKNNIYYQANVTAPSEQITFNGVENRISNGIADWLYEEEIFGTHKAVWWSPSGNYLAFVLFNDTQVSNITMSYYSDQSYPTNVNIPYPKVGASLPEAKNYNQNFTNFWAEPLNFVVRFADEQNYFVILPKSVEDESEKQHYWYSHIAKINVPQSGQNGKAVFLTDGPWEVIEIVGYSEKDKEFVSIFETTTSPKCWTCNMSKDGCSYVDAYFAPKGDHYILYCQGPETPTLLKLKTIQQALLKILYPPGFEENANKEFYPAVLRQVVEKWSVSFDTYLASAQKYIVLYIDARGSAYRGSKYTAPLYKNIGQLEIEDQIDAFKAFCSQYGQVDLQRTAVWGWSYGGFAAARIVQMDEFQIFKCASSVAPMPLILKDTLACTKIMLSTMKRQI